jgi:hypothetical protein
VEKLGGNFTEDLQTRHNLQYARNRKAPELEELRLLSVH